MKWSICAHIVTKIIKIENKVRTKMCKFIISFSINNRKRGNKKWEKLLILLVRLLVF